MLSLPGRTMVFCVEDGKGVALEAAGATVRRCAVKGGQVDPAFVLQELARMEINDVFVEAGPGLAGSLLVAGLVDEFVLYQAPHIMGSETRGMFDTPAWRKLDQRLDLEFVDERRFGRDTRIIARPVRIN
jgi:diaminohydroxyphosphoribosylaminopyrimidine deaminase/5-amino-6-(5-phosphoribosylamino)uracil reductase